MTLSTVISQFINLAVTPILSRLYSPEAFGIYAYVLAIMAVLGPVAGLKLENAIPLAESDREAGAVLRVGILAALCTTTITTLLSALIIVGNPAWTEGSNLAWVAYVGPLAFLTYLFTSLSQAILRRRAYGEIGRRNLAQSFGTSLGQVTGGLIANSAAGLLLGQAFGRVVSVWGLARASRDLLRAGVSLSAASIVLRTYWRFPLIFAPAAIVNNLGSYLPLFLIGHWFGVSAAGNLSMADRALMLPSAVIGVAVGQVMIGEVANRVRSGTGGSSALYLKASANLAIVALPLGISCFVLAPWFFPWALGGDWADAGEYARAMSVALIVGFVASPLSSLFYVFEGAFHQLLLDLARPSLVAASGWLAFTAGADSVKCVWAMYTAMALIYATTWCLGLFLARRSDAESTGIRRRHHP